MVSLQHIKKYFIVGILIFFGSIIFVHAQDTIPRIKIYQTWVSFTDPLYIVKKGVFFEIKDSSICLSNSTVANDYKIGKFEVADIQINRIEIIKVRRKNRILLGTGIGILTGFGLGMLFGFAAGDDPPCDPGFNLLPLECMNHRTAKQKAFTTGTILGITGGFLGMIFGSIKVKIPINGNWDNFKVNEIKLRKYPIVK